MKGTFDSHVSTNTPTSAQSKPQTAAPGSPVISSPYKKKTMSITQTYFLAHKARGKLSSEAARPDHNLRLLVGHANLLDSLMLELADAEREQESWFNQSVRGATRSEPKKDRHIQWADSVVEEPEEDWQAEDADSDSDDSSVSDSDSEVDDDEEDEEDDIEMVDAAPALRRVPSNKAVPSLRRDMSYQQQQQQQQIPAVMIEEDEIMEDDAEEDYAQLTLTRSPSHSSLSPPELDHDSDSSEDDLVVAPPSPPSPVALPAFSDKQKASIVTSEFFDAAAQAEEDKEAFYAEGFYLPTRSADRLVSAISVY